ncbi:MULTISPECIES: hypothetical protein [Haloferax]|jgi:hypothetical protein|uniref:Uncharacterized protein n=6 Tax=Haloferax TaxID=2251 RepID=A0A384KXI8_HALVD|nr:MULTISPECIES: hypothetical protein [Haloferax]ADE01859.2 uncharacterized protein HVO_A0334 [Haloferax volcanii DS2]ELK45684.1 hypothetical protein D320_21106 [Haloferax sp. BAB-2207]ELY31452.1 hypothetical protein C498_10301 [Haloferax volcanii DS2]ELZ59074.1 hypothetical protein C460_08105 [Haloferax sp. ATCC BAA-646]ELZ60365.1 hypothetical protein C459_16646 [Haloferax sp. ATCC BAA-645]
MRLGIGRTGVVILVALFVILGAEDVYVWAIAGTVPGVEFFLALVFVLAVAFVAIREARAHPPSR